MAKGYVIGRIAVHDEERYAGYRNGTEATLTPYGGHFIVRGGQTECVEGTWDQGRTVIIEFPSFEQAKAWYESDTYQQLAATRHAASTGDLVLVEGVA
jgi:uncharacterized protein (DUF1330 family)